MQTFTKSNISPKFHDAVRAGGASNKAVNNILRAGVQPKLKIGAVNDPAEVEADRVADQVMRMPAPASEGAQISTKANPSDINRKCTDCGDEEKIQRKETPDIRMKETGRTGGHTASAESSSAINSLGSGTPLPASERAFFEPRFGQDLSHIRVHTGGTADTASQSINARAFSLGNNIAFANGEYQPGTQSGRMLMAHEITHTLQGDSASKIRRYSHEDCDMALDLRPHIWPADHLAKSMVNDAIAALSARTVTTRTKGLLDRHFNDHSASTISTVLGVYRSIQSTFSADNYTYECEDECSGTLGYVYSIWTDIHLCMNNLRGMPNKQIAGIMVHEFSHYSAGTDDNVYYFYHGTGSAPSTLSISDAVENADSYEGFSFNI